MSNLWPYFQEKIDAIKRISAEEGILCDLYSGLRLWDEQNKIYALGRTVKNPDGFNRLTKPLGNIVTQAEGGYSWHNFGVAGDMVFKTSAGKWTWDGPVERLGEIGKSVGLEWGGDWKGAKRDVPHFQLTGGVFLARARDFKDNLPGLWNEIAKGLVTRG